MKVSILTHSVFHGAFGTIAENIATGLAAEGVEVDVLDLNDPAASDLPSYPVGVGAIELNGRTRICWLVRRIVQSGVAG